MNEAVSRSPLFQALCLILTAVILGLLTNQARRESLPLFEPLPQPKLETISIDQAQALFENNALLIDSRSAKAYERGHIRGALSLPIKDASSAYPKHSAELLGKTIIVYCSGPKCTKSELLAQMLLEKGHYRVFVLKAGLSGWKARGLPTK